MDSFRYERDYRSQKQAAVRAIINSEDFPARLEQLRLREKNWARIERALKKKVIPETKEAFDRILLKLDELAKQAGGKICAKIPTDGTVARIDYTVSFFQMSPELCPEEMTLLQDILEHCSFVTLKPSIEGGITLELEFEYFELSVDDAELDDETIALIQGLPEWCNGTSKNEP